MLTHVSIRNFLLIRNADIDFSSGFSVLTGDTGAGKSMFLKSIIFCLGGRFNSEVISLGADAATVTLAFRVNESIKDLLNNDYGIFFEEDLLVKRVHYANNRKKFFINGELVNQDIILKISAYLLEFHGQNMHNYLSDQSVHIDILDQFSHNSLILSQLKSLYHEINDVKSQINDIYEKKKFAESEIDYLEHIIKELEQIDVKEGEESALANKRIELQSQERERVVIKSISDKLNSNLLLQEIMSMQKLMSKSSHQSIIRCSSHLDQALIEIEEAIAAFNDICFFEDDELTLDEVEDRLFAIRNIARKHGKSADDLMNFLSSSKEKLSYLKNLAYSHDNLLIKLENLEKEFLVKSQEISEKRKNNAKILADKINAELSYLEMKDASFDINISRLEAYNVKGFDRVSFTARTNKGMNDGMISKIASGGELSRFMLAVRASLLEHDFSGLIIFDEIDTGLGGKVASSIGKRLRMLGEVNQVLVISHQPQVAALANNHYRIFKTEVNDITVSDIKLLDKNARKFEIARMLSADEITDAAISTALELIK